MTDTGMDAEATVRALFAAFAARDAQAARAVLHPDVELWAQPTAELAERQEPWRGADAFEHYLADVDRVWEEFTVDAGDFRVAGGGVICFGHATGRPRGSDVVKRLPVIWVFRLRGGKITYCRVARTAAEATELAAAGSAASDA